MKDKTISPVFKIVSVITCLLLLIALVLNYTEKQVSVTTQPKPTPKQHVKNYLTPPTQPEKVPGQIIIKFRLGLTNIQINSELQKYNAKVINKIDAIHRTVIQVPTGQEDQVLRQLTQDSFIQSAEPNYIQRVLFVPNDISFPNQWGLNNTGQTISGNAGTVHADINIEPAWDTTQGTNIKVAVIDTGMDMTHPDLASKVIAQKVFITNSINDMYGHGTHIAGIIAADTNNNQGIAGVCPNCKLLIAKAMDDNGISDTTTVSQAIVWAADNGANVINLSEGGTQFMQTQQDAINYAWNKGAVIVSAAGNNGVNQKFYPGAMTNVISVAATDNTDQKAVFSNYGTWVNVAAPGQDIYSTLPTYNYGMQKQLTTLQLNYDYLSGTSMATPIVSGIAALLWSSPYGTSNTAIVQRIESTADKITGTGTSWQFGRVNIAKALGVTNPTATPTPTSPSAPTPQPTFVCGGSTTSICPTLTPTPMPSGMIMSGTPTATPILPLPTPITTPIVSIPLSQIPSTSPCQFSSSVQSTTAVQQTQAKKKKNRHHKKNQKKNTNNTDKREDLLEELIAIIKKLLELIEKLIGTTPPSGTPCPTPTPVISSAPSATMSMAPSTTLSQAPTPIPSVPKATPVLSTTPSPTALMSMAPSTTLSQTPTPTLSTSPTTAPSGVVTETPTPILSTSPTSAISQAPTPTVFMNPSTNPTPIISQAQPSPITTPTPPNNNLVIAIIKAILAIINSIINLFLGLFK